MQNFRKQLPPMSSLVAFEAAARHAGFTRAAAELNVSQAAISRQVRGLEEFLGVSLFHRQHRAVRPTADGERLQQAVAMGLQHIARTVTELRRAPDAAQVTFSTTIAFASLWLMPRLARFHAATPGIELRLVATDPTIDLTAENIDAAVRYGEGAWPGLTARRLFDDELFPVCSPSYFDTRPKLDGPEALLTETLIQMDELDPTWIDWRTWFGAMGVTADPARPGLRFNNYTMAIQAAVSGQGIALGWRRLVADLLASGTLVRPIDAAMRSPGAHYLVVPSARETSPAAATVCDWIIAEAAAEF